AAASARHSEHEAQRWRRMRRDILQGEGDAAAPLKMTEASLEQKRQQVSLLRLQAQHADLWP
ncbi:unnamed protein product, partial [Effrenium voratum]